MKCKSTVEEGLGFVGQIRHELESLSATREKLADLLSAVTGLPTAATLFTTPGMELPTRVDQVNTDLILRLSIAVQQLDLALAQISPFESLGSWVRWMRDQREISVADLSERSHLSETTIRRIERGDPATLHDARAIAVSFYRFHPDTEIKKAVKIAVDLARLNQMPDRW